MSKCRATRDMMPDDPEFAGRVVMACVRPEKHTGKHHHRDVEGRLIQWWGPADASLTAELMAEQNARGFQPDPDERATQVRDALRQLAALRVEHGSEMAALMLLTGCTAEEITECGGLP